MIGQKMRPLAVLASLTLALATQNVNAGPVCAEAIAGIGVERALQSLKSLEVDPLCAEIAEPEKGDFWIRATLSSSSEYKSVRNIYPRHGRIVVDTDDTLFSPSGSGVISSRVRPQSFLRALKTAGLESLWMAPDDTCKDPEKLSVEAGMILEFYDATGYHLRSAPDILLRGCETPYSKVFHEVMELVNDLEAI